MANIFVRKLTLLYRKDGNQSVSQKMEVKIFRMEEISALSAVIWMEMEKQSPFQKEDFLFLDM